MADAEVKLNFTADSSRVKAELDAVRAMLERLEGSLSAIKEHFGDMPEMPGDPTLVEALTAEVERLRASYASLQTQFVNLQEVSGEMSTSFFAQVSALRKEVEEALDRCGQLNKTIGEQNARLAEQDGIIKGLNDTVDEQGKKIKELEKRLKDAPRGGASGFRSLRTIVGDFIVQLFKGKVAVGELGVALKGLAYSTVVLGAIQLAMDGIMWAWKGIKSLFGESKEEMKAAEEAAKRAQDELDKARTEAEKAAEEVQRLKEKLAEKEAAEALKVTLAGITAEYVAQREAVNDTLAALKEQARVKARERAQEAAAKTGELDMELLGLEERFVNGDIDKRNYVILKAEIEKRKRDEARVAAVDAAEIEAEAAAARVKAAKAELADAEERLMYAETEAGKYATDNDVELAEAEHEQLRTRMEEKFRELERLEAEFEEKYNGRLGIWGPTRDQMEHELRTGRILHKETRQYKADKEKIADARNVANIASDRELAKADEVKSLKESAASGKEASARLNEERKTAEKLGKDAEAAVDAERKANDTLRETLRRTSREGGLDDRMTGKRVDIEVARIDRDEREGRRRGLQRELDRVAKEANRLATDKDKANDTQAFDMMADLLSTYGRDIRQYGVNVASLLDVCGKLDLQGKSARAQMATLETRINRLQRQVDRTNSQQ